MVRSNGSASPFWVSLAQFCGKLEAIGRVGLLVLPALLAVSGAHVPGGVLIKNDLRSCTVEL